MLKLPIAAQKTQFRPKQGHWTYEDYLRLPNDGRRYEIIKGVLRAVNAPNFRHQFVAAEIFGELRNFVKKNNLGLVLAAPFEVHLSETVRPVQPDALFICRKSLPSANVAFFDGAPDLVVEVISPSSARIDRVTKFEVYERAGISEYWIASPKTRSVEVYTLSGGEYALRGEYTGEAQ
ncbi:MAG TPA: Uma2 family endonuclease [Chloroflexi bacterium]|nr:Uma2 family endonuclease [Chloroflexota bacterium]